MKITTEMLRAKDACANQVDIFAKEWPNGVVITEGVILRAVELTLDIDWFAKNFLTAPAWAECDKATAPAWAEYKKAIAAAWAEYEKVRDTALAEYKKAIAAAWARALPAQGG